MQHDGLPNPDLSTHQQSLSFAHRMRIRVSTRILVVHSKVLRDTSNVGCESSTFGHPTWKPRAEFRVRQETAARPRCFRDTIS